MLTKVALILVLASSAFQQSRVEKAVNFLRDNTVEASHVTPNQVSAQVASYVIHWHRGVVIIVNAGAEGWEKVVETQLETLVTDLGPNYEKLFHAEIEYIKNLLK